jgi:hypothetical protein
MHDTYAEHFKSFVSDIQVQAILIKVLVYAVMPNSAQQRRTAASPRTFQTTLVAAPPS